jgi:putative transposase
VYQGRFKCFPVQTDDYFLTAARYIERNALRAGLPGVDRAEQWRWSSLWLRGRSNRQQQSDVEQQLAATLADWPTGRPADWLRRVNRAEADAEL